MNRPLSETADSAAPYSLLDEEGVDVISWVSWVQIRFVPLNLSPNERLQGRRAAEDAVVGPRQAFHQRREGIVQLFREKTKTDRMSDVLDDFLNV